MVVVVVVAFVLLFMKGNVFFFYSVESVCTSTHASLCVCLAEAFMKNGGFLSHLFTYVWQR